MRSLKPKGRAIRAAFAFVVALILVPGCASSYWDQTQIPGKQDMLVVGSHYEFLSGHAQIWVYEDGERHAVKLVQK